jgi:hypothetical protein
MRDKEGEGNLSSLENIVPSRTLLDFSEISRLLT